MLLPLFRAILMKIGNAWALTTTKVCSALNKATVMHSSQAFSLTNLWPYCVDNSSIQMIVICTLGLHISHQKERAPLHIFLKVSFQINQSFAPLLCFLAWEEHTAASLEVSVWNINCDMLNGSSVQVTSSSEPSIEEVVPKCLFSSLSPLNKLLTKDHHLSDTTGPPPTSPKELDLNMYKISFLCPFHATQHITKDCLTKGLWNMTEFPLMVCNCVFWQAHFHNMQLHIKAVQEGPNLTIIIMGNYRASNPHRP